MEQFNRWIYEDTDGNGKRCFVVATKKDEFGYETRFGLKLYRNVKNISSEQVGQLYLSALKLRDSDFEKDLEKILGESNA